MKKLLTLLLALPLFSAAQTYELVEVTSGKSTSMRGLSVVSDQVAWVSGSNGFIGKNYRWWNNLETGNSQKDMRNLISGI